MNSIAVDTLVFESHLRNASMGFEKPRSVRWRLDYPARIDAGDGSSQRDCLIADISDAGAKLVIEAHRAAVKQFTLWMSGSKTRCRRCHVVLAHV